MRDVAGVGDFDRDGTIDIAAVRKSTSRLEIGLEYSFYYSVTGFTSNLSPVL